MRKNLNVWIIGVLVTLMPLQAIGQTLSEQVIIHRTEYGVPHIMADNIKAAFYAMGYLQLEDYGMRTPTRLLKARGEWALHQKQDSDALSSRLWIDARSRRSYQEAKEKYHLLNQQTKDMLEGFVAGVNRYIRLNPDEFPDWMEPEFTAADVHARGMGRVSPSTAREFIGILEEWKEDGTGSKPVIASSTDQSAQMWQEMAMVEEELHPDAGSNVWALAPERTTSGNAILMRNPHMHWNAGYYEAHIIVPDTLDFYGDFRVGGPLGIVGGFNQHLGWSTTNNYPDTEEIYALRRDPEKEHHYLLDGTSHPLIEEKITVDYKTKDDGIASKSRTIWSTPYGDVVKRDKEHVYIVRSGGEGRYTYTRDQQFLSMMMATNLEEWKTAMKHRARASSNFTYADADGNIFYVWNANVPKLSHASGGDTTAILASRSEDIWSELIPFDELPQLLNPEGGYLRNENDPFHYTNLNEVLKKENYPSNFPEPRLRLRSQLSLELIAGNDKLSLEDVVELKHNMRALLADRVKPDLVQAVRASNPSGELLQAINTIDQWDNTVSRESRGGILFEQWWDRYVDLARGTNKEVSATPESAGYKAPAENLFTKPWSTDDPVTTPQGLASKDIAVDAFKWAIEETKNRYGAWNVTQGEVKRARIGQYEYPVGGASGDMGAFRVMWFREHTEDSLKSQARGGDGWVFAVEFGQRPRAYSVLPYGNTNKEESSYYANQLELFTNNEMKPVVFTKEEIVKKAVRSYKP